MWWKEGRVGVSEPRVIADRTPFEAEYGHTVSYVRYRRTRVPRREKKSLPNYQLCIKPALHLRKDNFLSSVLPAASIHTLVFLWTNLGVQLPFTIMFLDTFFIYIMLFRRIWRLPIFILCI